MTTAWKKLLGRTRVLNVTDVKAAVGWSATAGIGALYFIQPWSFLRDLAFGEEEK